MRSNIVLLLLTVSLVAQCKPVSEYSPSNAAPVSHALWDAMLAKWVSAEGKVDYDAFRQNRGDLDAYLETLRAAHPNESWTKNERKAYWINAYNAFTIQLMLDNWGVRSIKELKMPWDRKFIKIEGQSYSLNTIEHTILRKRYTDPRIHFVLVCASYSCPRLLNSAYVAEKLDQQMDAMARDFINDERKNTITEKQAELSKLFSWYSGDFTKNGSLVEYLNQYSEQALTLRTKITYKEYDWSLNDR